MVRFFSSVYCYSLHQSLLRWRLRGVFCCCVLLEAKTSCAQSRIWKELKLLSLVFPHCSIQHSDGHCLGSPPACLETRVLDNPTCAPAGSLQNHHVSDFLLISNLFQGKEDCRGERPDPHRHTTVLHNFRTRDTHSLLRFSRPVKAPLVSSIVPEMSLWSSSLGRGQVKAHNQRLNPRVIIQNKQKLWEWQRASFPFPRDT